MSASPAIGRYTSALVRDKLGLSLRSHFVEVLPEYLADMHPDEGDVVCLDVSRRGVKLATDTSPRHP